MTFYEKNKLYVYSFLCFLPMIFLRDFTPGNELRYLNIVDQALQDGTFFTFHWNGAIYADKPPLYFWLMMLGKTLLGSHQMWFISLFSIIPAFVVVRVMAKWVNVQTPLFLFSTALFLGSTLVLRMDMLMTMFIVLALKMFWNLYTLKPVTETQKKFTWQNIEDIEKSLYQRSDSTATVAVPHVGTKDSILFGLLIFLAVFSKGPYGIMIPLVATLVYSLFRKEIRTWLNIWNWKVWTTIIIFFALWMLCVYIEGGGEYISNLLFHQTVDRGVNSFKHNEPIYYYLYTTLYDLLPWTPLSIYVAWKCWRVKFQLDDLQKYFLVIIVSTFILLSLISSKAEVYMLPIYPFIIFLTTRLYALLIRDEYCRDRWDFAGVIGWFVLAATLIAGLAMPFINPYIGFRDLSEECVRLNEKYGYDKFYGLELHRCQEMKYYDESLDVELVLAQDTIERDYRHSIVIVDPRARKRALALPTTAIDSAKVGNFQIYVVPEVGLEPTRP